MQNLLTGMLVVCPVAFALFTLGLFFLIGPHGEALWRASVAKRFRVEIEIGGRGHWQVVSPAPWYKKLGIELLQLGFFMALFFLWALGALGLVVLLNTLQKFAGG